MPNLEIERKFLLKRLPNIQEDDLFEIEQYYIKTESGIWERARTYHSDVNGDKYIHTVKTPVSPGVNMEDERELTKAEFLEFKDECLHSDRPSRHISKKRYIYNYGDLKWEVDKFNSGYHLIIAEIELPTENYDLTIPKFIKDVKLIEVTGLKQFNNRRLSIKINKDG